ncbi:hypothetical protein JVU11DRAFT_9625 [Chiua virens]|nr:hypothetical protein JVU11DRAFT_9625 [Chiua virens]
MTPAPTAYSHTYQCGVFDPAESDPGCEGPEPTTMLQTAQPELWRQPPTNACSTSSDPKNLASGCEESQPEPTMTTSPTDPAQPQLQSYPQAPHLATPMTPDVKSLPVKPEQTTITSGTASAPLQP